MYQNILKLPLWGHFRTRTVTPILHQDPIKQSRTTTDDVKSTKEYFSGHQILSAGHISSILIKIYNFSVDAIP